MKKCTDHKENMDGRMEQGNVVGGCFLWFLSWASSDSHLILQVNLTLLRYKRIENAVSTLKL